MFEREIRDRFVNVYNANADDIFAYCLERVTNRDIAKYLTRNIFMRTWDIVSGAGKSVVNIERTLFATAKEHIRGFVQSKQRELSQTENLWNLTLSQPL